MKNRFPEDKPREKILNRSPSVLTDTELIAILLRSGTRNKEVLQLSRDLLKAYGGLRGLLNRSPADLVKVKGIGPAKSASLLVVREVCRRLLRENMIGKSFVKSPEDVKDYLQLDLRDQKREYFKVILLNQANQILDEKTLFEGCVNQAQVHPREIIKYALDQHATALVLVHNHPSGLCKPSEEDCRLTERLSSLCNELNLKVLDHLIVGDNQVYSFREEGIKM